MKVANMPALRTSHVTRIAAFALSLLCAATAIAGVGDGFNDSLELVASAPTGAAAQPAPAASVPSMSAGWLAKHDVRAGIVEWNVVRMPTATGFQVEVAAHTPAGLQLAVRCENASPTMDKVKFSTNAVDLVTLKFDQAWFKKGERLELACTAGGQRRIERLIV
jgi:hypothetical protein